jgi:peptidoglycan hydrolase-like amidase
MIKCYDKANLKASFLVNKINTKFILLFLLLGFFAFFCGVASVHAAYQYEDISFYAQANPAAYAQEGIVFYTPTTQADSNVPVYRFYNSTSGDHFYSTENVAPAQYAAEGTVFYAYPIQTGETVPVYQFYNSVNGDHFYTISADERTTLLNNPQWGYTADGIAFYVFAAQSNGTSPVYRFYNSSTGDHFYTASESEKNSISLSPVYRFYNSSTGDHFYTASESEKTILSNNSQSGYLPEGIAFYAHSNQANNTVPIYRYYNSSTGDHFYSTDNSTPSGYSSEGTAFYAYSSQVSGSVPVYRFYDPDSGDHYYTISESEKTRLTKSTLGPEISVGLWNYTKSDIQNNYFKVSANKKYNIKDKNGNVIAQIAGGTTTNVKYDTDSYFKVSGSIATKRIKTEVNFDAADGDNTSLIIDAHRPSSDYDQYRGKIKIRHTDSSNNWVINTLPLEHYTWGEGETTGTGDINHTRVMTTMFRTYGYWYLKYATKYSAWGFKIKSDSGSQIYRGYEWETGHPNIKSAAQDTHGVVATYDNDVALTPYCSWSDGRTRSFEEVWGSKDYPWCKSVDDPYGKNDSMTTAELKAAGNHMVGLIANGSVHLAAEHDWSWSKIMKYYYTGIDLDPVY